VKHEPIWMNINIWVPKGPKTMAFSKQDCMCMEVLFVEQSNDNHQTYHVPLGSQTSNRKNTTKSFKNMKNCVVNEHGFDSFIQILKINKFKFK
jgi:hypothetical protein